MPAQSAAQRRLMSIGEYHPEQLYQRNRGILKMSHSQLHDFAATKEKGLPARKNGTTKKRPGFGLSRNY